MSAWRKAGLTYNNYMAIAAQTVRSALKTEAQSTAVISRGRSEAKFVNYENGKAVAEPVALKK
ncbi:LANO_0A07096g1_1 [Lachancea nothofagi CBS 11611]|uniref:LANO_0A07096g1_1 n=1 Tax=Lachancea nothofagi CBS 11611 TaxID=1266666 RepID=A0A1G4IS11_9SACH|nr:LANO_0A07096g1_1 [Lachancea nothofagi CBS 11611]